MDYSSAFGGDGLGGLQALPVLQGAELVVAVGECSFGVEYLVAALPKVTGAESERANGFEAAGSGFR